MMTSCSASRPRWSCEGGAPPHVAEYQSLQPGTGASREVPSRAAASHRVRTKDHGRSSAEPVASSWPSRGRATGRAWTGTHLSLQEG